MLLGARRPPGDGDHLRPQFPHRAALRRLREPLGSDRRDVGGAGGAGQDLHRPQPGRGPPQPGFPQLPVHRLRRRRLPGKARRGRRHLAPVLRRRRRMGGGRGAPGSLRLRAGRPVAGVDFRRRRLRGGVLPAPDGNAGAFPLSTVRRRGSAERLLQAKPDAARHRRTQDRRGHQRRRPGPLRAPGNGTPSWPPGGGSTAGSSSATWVPMAWPTPWATCSTPPNG